MPLLQILTDPKNFKFYAGGKGYVSNTTAFGQRSIKYGNDRLNGANSGQPYVTVPLPDPLESSKYIGTTDFLQRGGINVVRDTATDVERIAKMFTDTKSPNGILFTAKQQLLSRTAVRTQTSGLLNEGTYSPLNTLAQTGVIAFGGHLNKQGINPFADTGAYANNEALYGVRVKPTQQPEINRLVQLLDVTSTNSTKGNFGGKGTTLNPGGNTGGVLMSYTGGPNSNLGVGSTNIRYSPTSQTSLTLDSKYTLATSQVGNSIWVYSSKLVSTPYYSETTIVGPLLPGQERVQQTNSPNRQGSIASPKIQDFRKVLRNNLQGTAQKSSIDSGATPDAPPYNAKNIEQRVNLGDPGQRSFIDGKPKSYADYTKGIDYGNVELKTNPGSPGKSLGSYTTGLDKITSVPIYRSSAAAFDEDLNDLVKFRIAILDNNVSDGQVYKMFMHFRAFLGPMSDSYNADWSAFKYLGRGENFYTYQGFTRQISLSWTVAAQSKQELIPMYKKLNYLASSLTPDYSPQGYMRGNLAQLTVGGYLYEQPGIITGLTYDIQEDTPWEIGINTAGGFDGTVKEMPHIIRVSGFNFIPIQSFVARKQELAFSPDPFATSGTNDGIGLVAPSGSGIQQYIALSNGLSNNYNT
jgi:hypothetical protein